MTGPVLLAIEENAATQLLVTNDTIDRRKARVVADALETRGFTTRIVERAYDQHFRPFIHGDPARNEPTIALAGFDDIAPRRQLGQAGFSRVVDAGLGIAVGSEPANREVRVNSSISVTPNGFAISAASRRLSTPRL